MCSITYGVCGLYFRGSHLRVASCLLLPAVQLAVGICNPSWVSLPFFIGRCAGLVDWSLTSNVSGLFRWWRVLYIYSGFNIILLYLYQLSIKFSYMIRWIASIIGLFRISAESEGPDICSGLFLVLFSCHLSSEGTSRCESPSSIKGKETDDKSTNNESVSAVLYDLLQKEVITLRKAANEKDQSLRDKDEAIELKTNKTMDDGALPSGIVKMYDLHYPIGTQPVKHFKKINQHDLSSL